MKRSMNLAALALSSALMLSTVAGMTACGKDSLAAEAKEKITFWGNGDENENKVFQELVQQFNEQNKGEIYVNYELQSSDQYADRVQGALGKSRATVDVLYINDDSFKKYAKAGYLEPLDDYLKDSKEIVVENMWESSINRYLYDVNTTTQDGPDAHYYGIPKDIGPTVIFYNETHFTQAGVKVISVAAEDLDAFNAGTKADDRGQLKSALGIAGTVKEKGYFIDDNNQKWFNNQIPMSWEECVALSKVVQTKQRELHNITKNDTYYGYFTEWWFSYGWSVGGDCIEYVPQPDDDTLNGGYWEFTLMEDTPNYIVADDAEPFTINGNTYQPGEILSWNDKLADVTAETKVIAAAVTAAKNSGQLNELPSQRDAFVEFVRVGQMESREVENGLNGYGICPSPTTIQGDSGKALYFKNGYVSMLVDGRWNVVDFRENLCSTPGSPVQGGFEWDVAPLPMYKQYDEEGNITVHGIEAGHSGSVALSINKRSKKKEAAWKFVEFIGGATGQTAQSKSGFAIPSQKELANDEEIFLQTNMVPRNSKIFLRAAEVQTPGDWWYLQDKLWIDDWAGVLNGDVRNGKKTLTQFENSSEFKGTNAKLRTYTKK